MRAQAKMRVRVREGAAEIASKNDAPRIWYLWRELLCQGPGRSIVDTVDRRNVRKVKHSVSISILELHRYHARLGHFGRDFLFAVTGCDGTNVILGFAIIRNLANPLNQVRPGV